MTQQTRVLLDVDTGIDDALALLYATATSRLDVVGVSAVVGNVPVDVGARNTAAVLAAVGKASIPVAAGAASSTEGNGPRLGPTNHGPDGLGGVRVGAPGPVGEPHPDAMRLFDVLTSDRPVTVAACAPLTNVAQYTSRPGAERVVLVGGEPVVEDEPEFNVGQDPAAAVAVLEAGLPTTVYPVDLFDTVVASPALVARMQSARTPAARLAGELLGVRRGHVLGDAGALVFLTHPELFEVTTSRMAVVDRRLVPIAASQAGFVVDLVVAVHDPRGGHRLLPLPVLQPPPRRRLRRGRGVLRSPPARLRRPGLRGPPARRARHQEDLTVHPAGLRTSHLPAGDGSRRVSAAVSRVPRPRTAGCRTARRRAVLLRAPRRESPARHGRSGRRGWPPEGGPGRGPDARPRAGPRWTPAGR
ncbi:hypothetical protein G5V58_06160 [Nocardioides anomalus]|uniref:Inosine/uridine-preferring nucleoside hydrolase domain-containing protein n=1 Tax=Nocardioides anomalus TaxID=2712223 RepID=A0A6G6WB22_9ACTN|nr:hypothetical protein G5V58_06160 [Nocardioides anomalus]